MRKRPLEYAALVVCLAARAASAQAPAGFEVTTVVEGLEGPIALAPAPSPDDRLFVALRDGRIIVIRNGVVQDAPFATLEVFTGGECGLLGLTLDVDFARNQYVYAFATISPNEQQILRLVDDGGVASHIDIIRGNLPTSGSNHNGGGLKAAPDGMLYFSIGDNGEPAHGQDISTLAGKVCRMNRDGSIPADNPFVTPSGSPRAVWALGFRNPFRMCVAADGRLFAGDVGSAGDMRREELNLVSAGQNYGWPDAEGIVANAADLGFTNPVAAYAEEGSSIAGCAVYEAAQFPPEYYGDVFHLDYVSGGLYRVHFTEGGEVRHELFYQAEGGPVDLVVDRDGSLLFAELVTGRIRRIAAIANSTVVPDPTPDPTAGGLPPRPVGCGAGLALTMASGLFAPLIRRRALSRFP